MRDFKSYYPLKDSLRAKQAEFAETLKTQLKLSSEMKSICMNIKWIETAAFYRDMEKDFEDLQKLMNTKN